MDHFGAGFVIYIMACLEVIGIMWIYGLNNFCKDVEFMLQMKISLYWKFCWGFVVPLTLIAVLAYTLLTSTTVTHGSAHFPDIAICASFVNKCKNSVTKSAFFQGLAGVCPQLRSCSYQCLRSLWFMARQESRCSKNFETLLLRQTIGVQGWMVSGKIGLSTKLVVRRGRQIASYIDRAQQTIISHFDITSIYIFMKMYIFY